MVLDASLLNTQDYKISMMGKWNNPGEKVLPSPTPQSSGYRKGNLRETLDYGLPTYYLYIYIYIYIYIYMKMYREQ